MSISSRYPVSSIGAVPIFVQLSIPGAHDGDQHIVNAHRFAELIIHAFSMDPVEERVIYIILLNILTSSLCLQRPTCKKKNPCPHCGNRIFLHLRKSTLPFNFSTTLRECSQLLPLTIANDGTRGIMTIPEPRKLDCHLILGPWIQIHQGRPNHGLLGCFVSFEVDGFYLF